MLLKEKGKTHKGSGGKKPGEKGKETNPSKMGTVESEKRKRSDSSSNPSTSPTGGLKPNFKIPRVNKPLDTTATPPAGGAESMDVTPAGNKDDETVDEDGIVESEEQYGPLESFPPDLDGALPDYAGATQGKKARMSYPHLLYVHKGKTL